MQFFTCDADLFGQCCFDVHVHIFQLHRPLEITAFDLDTDFFQAADNIVAFLFAQNADFAQHFGVGNRTLDVLTVHALIKIDGCRVAGNESIDRFREAATPGGVGRR